MAFLYRLCLLPLLILSGALFALAAPLAHLPPGAIDDDPGLRQGFTSDGVHGAAIPNRYIITLKNGLSARHVDSHLDWVDGVHRRSGNGTAATSLFAGIRQTYTRTQWHGYAGEFDDQTIDEIRANPDVSLRPVIVSRIQHRIPREATY